MKKILITVLVLGMIAAAASAAPAASEFKIGAIFASTGPASMLGLPEKNTAEMLAEELNAAGGINGKPVKLIFYDTEGDATKTVTATNKLINKDNVDVIIGPTTSGTSMAIIDLVSREKVPLISCAASIHIVVPVKEWVFKTPQSDTMAVEKIYETLKEKGIEKVAVITVSDGYGDSGRAELLKLAPQFGLSIVA
ncbi:MAG: ABC transporter substrate-binding protein, partial [Proteobacteria bacterium]|nr:ABC transporter substrate-binding protein [Pseudomonadota bacterium]